MLTLLPIDVFRILGKTMYFDTFQYKILL